MLSLVLLYGTLAVCAVLVGWLVVRYDLYEREPVVMLVVAVVLGAVGMYLAGRAQVAVIAWEHGRGRLVGNAELAVLAGVTEEAAKFAVVVGIALGCRRWFNEPVDGLIYGAFAGLGAALEESVAVLTMDGSTGFLPAQEPVRLAGHLVMGGIGGFGVGLVVIRGRRAALGIGLCLLGAVALHALWDVVAFAATDAHRASGRIALRYGLAAIGLMLGGMVVFRSMVTVGVRMTGVMLGVAPGGDRDPGDRDR